MKTETTYAIIDNEGRFLTSPNETGSGKYISLFTKEKAQQEIEIYYRNKGYRVRKLKTK